MLPECYYREGKREWVETEEYKYATKITTHYESNATNEDGEALAKGRTIQLIFK